MRDVVIAGAARTAIGKFGGTLTDVPVTRLGALVVVEALARAGVAREDIDEVIMGHVLQAGAGLNTARQVVIEAGLPVTTPGFTVNKVCASGMKAVVLAAQSIAVGANTVVVAGGMENMSASPYLVPAARWGQRLGDARLLDVIQSDALVDPGHGCHMGITAETLAAEFAISREAQDAFAAASQQKATAAIQAGKFAAEITPVHVPQKKGAPTAFVRDEFPRPDTTAEVLATLKPAFKADGTVTAGNASGINDGAAALVLMSAGEARRRGVEPMARIVSCAAAAVEPERMGIGPAPATRAALEKAGLTLEAIDAIELNEAFAAQSLAVLKELALPLDHVNVNGGAIALGHPVGASGARILVTLLHILADCDLRLGLATLCVGGGQGMAMVVERGVRSME